MRTLAYTVHSSCCSTSGRLHSNIPARPHPAWCKPSSRQSSQGYTCQAGEGGKANKSGEDDAAAEARLEAFERGVKRKQGWPLGTSAVAAVQAVGRWRESRSAGSRSVAMAERRGAQLKAEQQKSGGGLAEWPEGQLFPEGWDEMTFGQKASELYVGKRGLLFWFNKAAYASVFIILGGWVIFRFVLPALGLYSLTNDLSSPPVQ